MKNPFKKKIEESEKIRPEPKFKIGDEVCGEFRNYIDYAPIKKCGTIKSMEYRGEWNCSITVEGFKILTDEVWERRLMLKSDYDKL